jgi:hypothetical protein
MISNLHHSYQPMNILRSLNDQGLQALNATNKTKQTPWPLVRKRTIPTERPPLVSEI